MIYAKCLKRVLDFMLSLFALIVLSPVLLALTAVGAVAMGGNPFFTQDRPGKNERIFKLVKFRTMTNKKDKNGKLLPDEKRLTRYGRILRQTSLDELPELFNILIGDMSIVGPRPLIPEYLPYYTKKERLRHSVRPGLTGLAQVNGRSFLTWEEIFAYDVQYAKHITLAGDIRIIIQTAEKVLKHKDIADTTGSFVDESGHHHIMVDGKEKVLHQRLDVERSQHAAGDRK